MRCLLCLITAVILLPAIACTASKPAPSQQTGKTDISTLSKPGSSDSDMQSGSKEPLSTPDSSGASTADAQTGVMPSSDSGVTSFASPGLPDGWPDYLPIIPGMTVVMGNTSTGMGVGYFISATGKLSLDEVQAFYMTLDGWVVDTDKPPKTDGEQRDFIIKYGGNDKEYARISIITRNNETVLHISYRKVEDSP